MHSFVERLLVERLGDAGRRLHTGRSRNEQVSLDLRLYLRRRIPLLQRGDRSAWSRPLAGAGVRRRRRASCRRSRTSVRRSRCWSRTSSWRTSRRSGATSNGFDAARSEADCAAARVGRHRRHRYAVDVNALARDLGFSRVVANSIDASSDRDFAATFLYACATTMVHLSRLAEDLIILSGDEHRFFELSDALSTGSSMMPQKKNPDPLELVRGKSGRAIGSLMALLTTLKGLPSGYNKDLQEDKHAVFDAEDTVAGCLCGRRVGGRRPGARSRARRAGGIRLAPRYRRRGLSRRRAACRSGVRTKLSVRLVRRLVAEKREFGSLSLEEWRAASDLFEADIVTRVTPRAVRGGQAHAAIDGARRPCRRLWQGPFWRG